MVSPLRFFLDWGCISLIVLRINLSSGIDLFYPCIEKGYYPNTKMTAQMLVHSFVAAIEMWSHEGDWTRTEYRRSSNVDCSWTIAGLDSQCLSALVGQKSEDGIKTSKGSSSAFGQKIGKASQASTTDGVGRVGFIACRFVSSQSLDFFSLFMRSCRRKLHSNDNFQQVRQKN